MASRFEKNVTDKGYLMKYENLSLHSDLKNQVLQFSVELQGIEPKIWRRIHVPSDYNFWDLHVAIQDAMGWQDYHLHHFEIKGKGKRKEVRIGIPDLEGSGELPEVFPGWEIAVIAYFNSLGVEAVYEYDYGDGWLHTVKLDGYMFREKGIKYPICIDGKNACPPEDCGGVDGYYNVIEILSDLEHDDHEDMRTWAGKDWDPKRFDPASIGFDNPYKRWRYAFLSRK
jgi:hypothetical protein